MEKLKLKIPQVAGLRNRAAALPSFLSLGDQSSKRLGNMSSKLCMYI